MQEKNSSAVRRTRNAVAVIDAIVPLLIVGCLLLFYFNVVRTEMNRQDHYANLPPPTPDFRIPVIRDHLQNYIQHGRTEAANYAANILATQEQIEQKIRNAHYRSTALARTKCAEYARDMEKWKQYSLIFGIPAFIDALLVLYNNFYNSTDQQKSRALAKINAALK